MNQNQSEKDELENAFLSIDSDTLRKKITPNKDLSNYELDIKEIMNTGCNRQLAEYVLNKIDINSKLQEDNKKYLKAKKQFIDEIKGKIRINKDIIEKANTDVPNFDFEILYEKIFFEEIIEELASTYLKKYSQKYKDYEVLLQYKVRSKLIKTIKENEELKIHLDEYIKSKNEYIKKRQPVIEAAFRLLKKILNDEKEYKNFYEYYNNNTNNNKE